MTLRALGSTGPSVAPLIVRGNVFGWIAGGATTIDTADAYSAFAPGNVGGESQTILGRWMKRRGNPLLSSFPRRRESMEWGHLKLDVPPS